MVPADLLYNLDLKLREITMQHDKLMGGVSIFALGDLYQLQPVNGHYVFEEPSNEEHRVSFTLRNLWHQFQVVNLEENHRQGAAKEFGDLLNRIRVGAHTKEDLEFLQTRVRSEKECGKPQLYQGQGESNEVFNYIKKGNDSGDTGNKSEEMKEKECGQPHPYKGQGESNKVLINKKDENGSIDSGRESVGMKDLDADTEMGANAAIHIYGTNLPVTKRNLAVLNEMPGELYEIHARNMHRTMKNWKPKTDNAGCVKNTPFQSVLKLKKGAEVILTLNINTVDGLTNGARGTLLNVEKKNGAVSRLIVEFHNPEHGREQREKMPCKRYPQGTYIEPVMWQYLEKGLTASVFQFPVRLAASITSHKIQVKTQFISQYSILFYAFQLVTNEMYRMTFVAGPNCSSTKCVGCRHKKCMEAGHGLCHALKGLRTKSTLHNGRIG